METLNNPHDKFFKEVMGQREIARDFLMNYLPPETARFIDFNTISPEKDSLSKKSCRNSFLICCSAFSWKTKRLTCTF